MPEPQRFHHAEVGEIRLDYQAVDVRSAPGQQLVVYHATAGTADALALLGALAVRPLAARPGAH